MSKPVFFYELCRLCLENAGVCNVLESSNLLEDIYECTGVKVLSSDNLPHTICAKCSAVVQEAKELRTLAKKNDAHLRCLFDMNCCDEITKKDEGINDISNLEKVCGQGTGNYKNANKETNAAMKPKIGKDCSEDNGVDGSPTKKMGRPIKKMGRPIKKMGSPIKNMGSPTKKIKPEERYTKLLETKVKAEHQPKKLKTEDDMIVEFVCGICLKDFSNQKKFYLHQRLHNKKCVCPFDACGKKFATKGDLAKHTRIHTGERPYKCHICTKSFNQKVTLSNHMQSVHPKDTEEDGD